MHFQPFTIANPDPAALMRQVDALCQASRASATRRAYASDIADYRAFCAQIGVQAVPSTEAGNSMYIASLASQRLTVSTIRRRLAAIASADHDAGYSDSAATQRTHSLLRQVFQGIKRTLGTAQHGRDPLFTGQIAALVAAIDITRLIGLRDRSMVLLGYAAGLRRSELAGLRSGDCVLTDAGLFVTLTRSKTDQEGAGGQQIAVPYGQHPETCPVRAYLEWTRSAKIGGESDSVYQAVDCAGRLSGRPLHPRSIAKILKRLLGAAGVDPTNLGPHSLRVGMVSQAARNGASAREIAEITQHRRLATVDRYVREADRWRANASARLGL